jgi:multiple sugar transport system substrate-binding protein
MLTGMAALGLTLTACGGGPAGGGGPVEDVVIDTSQVSGEIDYWLWDTNQLPAYQQCADAFKQANPNATVSISQFGYTDYWSKLSNGFVAGDAPDVFTNHLSKYPEIVTNHQLVPLDATLANDGFDVNQYQPGLADLWKGQDGKRYGLPKDFDTVAIFYNKKMTDEAGLTAEQLNELTWNPQDGGSYERAIAHLTVDENGVRGDAPGFDKENVAVYGLGLDGSAGSGVGQTQWSMYTGSNNWTYTDKNPWGTHYNYDQPQFQETIGWFFGLIDKGYMPSLAAVTGQSSSDIFSAGRYAMVTNGSWMINTMFGYEDIDTGVAPTPTGPSGKRASMYNGLADSIWVGSENKPVAAKWVEFAASPECQNVVGQAAIVFPAIPAATEKAVTAWRQKGIDVSPFTVHLDEKTTFLFPITDYASQIDGIMQPAMDAVAIGEEEPSSLTEANEQVNQLFSQQG